MSLEFFITALIVILIPGTGVIYTIITGIARGRLASIAAAFGCTLGIIPHIFASILGLSAILHTSALLFQTLKYAGAIYLIYLAYQIITDKGALKFEDDGIKRNFFATIKTGFLINILNPKLSIFFLAFLPQFTPANQNGTIFNMSLLAVIFMLMTFIVFIIYGAFAAFTRQKILSSKKIMLWFKRSTALVFVALGLRLALSEK